MQRAMPRVARMYDKSSVVQKVFVKQWGWPCRSTSAPSVQPRRTRLLSIWKRSTHEVCAFRPKLHFWQNVFSRDQPQEL